MKKLNLKMKSSVPNEADGDLHFKLQGGRQKILRYFLMGNACPLLIMPGL